MLVSIFVTKTPQRDSNPYIHVGSVTCYSVKTSRRDEAGGGNRTHFLRLGTPTLYR